MKIDVRSYRPWIAVALTFIGLAWTQALELDFFVWKISNFKSGGLYESFGA